MILYILYYRFSRKIILIKSRQISCVLRSVKFRRRPKMCDDKWSMNNKYRVDASAPATRCPLAGGFRSRGRRMINRMHESEPPGVESK